ncbi:MAG TPA: SCP2 sterol-binding domain-containing protein [Gaiellaceae bacterium]|jgi:putative sterol carrier protein
MPQSPKEFFETLETRVDPAKAAGLNASYRFDIDGAGSWLVEVDDGKVSVTEDGGEADTIISTSAETFMKIAGGEQNPTSAYMSGKLKVKGDIGQAMKLQKLF